MGEVPENIGYAFPSRWRPAANVYRQLRTEPVQYVVDDYGKNSQIQRGLEKAHGDVNMQMHVPS